MKKALFSLSILVISTFANAIPNVWVSGYLQGWSEMSISNKKGQKLWIACNDGYDTETLHSVSLESNGQTYENIELLIDGNVVSPGLAGSPREWENEWVELASYLPKAKKIEVYLNNKKVAVFSPTAKSSKKELSDICGPALPRD